MNKLEPYEKLWLFLIAAAAIVYGGSTFAVNDVFRCTTGQLVQLGDAQGMVEQECGQPQYQHTTNTGGRGDQVFYYYQTSGNLTEELQFIDGHLYAINDLYH